MKCARSTLLFLLLALLLPPLCAVSQPPPGKPDPMTAQRWTSDLHAVDRVLRSYSWADGLASDGAVLQSMQDHMEGGEGAARLLAMAELLKAVAEEGLGKSEEALWDWQTAWNLSPEIGGVNLGVYGSAGTR